VGGVLVSGGQASSEKNPPLPPRLSALSIGFVALGLCAAVFWLVAAWEKEMGQRRAFAARDIPRLEAAADRLALVGRDGPRIHVLLGRAYAEKGEVDKAKRAFERSLELAPNPAAWVGLGTLYEAKKDLDAAKDAYNAALGIDPENASALDRLAAVFLAKGDVKKALDTGYHAALAAPERPEIRRRYEEMLAHATKNTEEAGGEEIVIGGGPADVNAQSSETSD